MGLALATFILPAVSGLAFLGPFAVASKKKLYSEAFLLGFTTFFVILHHLCLTPGLSLIFCLMGDKLLEYFSTYGILLSVYCTLVQMTSFSAEKRHNISTSGGLLTAVRVFQTTEGYGIYVAPLTIGLLMVVLSWGEKMWHTKRLYPEKQKWIKLILPGFMLLFVSLLLKFALQSWSVPISQTLHIITMATSIAFLIKVSDDGEGIDTKPKCCSVTTACCLC
ncbi:protein myomaker-like [Clavelina lepadiformis]|uniref:protein myomaker-like n=1 Tax=Clavelina lepadiformis TaxID=159417 RepID=UPI004040FE28